MPIWAYMIVICHWCRCCCCWHLCLWTVLSKSRFKDQIIVLTPDSLNSTGNGMWGTKLRPSWLSKRSVGVAPVVNLHNTNKSTYSFGSFAYVKRSLYDHDLSLLLLLLVLTSVSVDSSAINFQNGCLWHNVAIWRQLIVTSCEYLCNCYLFYWQAREPLMAHSAGCCQGKSYQIN